VELSLPAVLDDWRWLVGAAATPWLARAREELAHAAGPSAALLTKLRKDLSAERARLVVEQFELRRRAREKFALAEQMFFTRKGLEQATDEQVAAVKAARVPGDQPVRDLCCGIGGDLLGLARQSPAFGYDQDEVAVLLARANAVVWGYSEAQCSAVVGDAIQYPVLGGGPWHIDPDRRPKGRRTTTADWFEPPLAALERKLGENTNAAVKLAPATEVPEHWQVSAERQWLGSRGECRQQVAWFGSLARHPGRHSATIVDARSGPRTIVGSPNEMVPTADRLGRYLLEPHAAVLAARLTGTLCREHELATVSPGCAYLTTTPGGWESLPSPIGPDGKPPTGTDSRPLSDRLPDEPALAAFEVLDVLPLDQKQLRAYCRERNIGRLEVKKRGVDVDPERLRNSIIGSGDEAATLIVTPLQGDVRAIVARRISPPPSADQAGR
jgi:hypothetical protein